MLKFLIFKKSFMKLTVYDVLIVINSAAENKILTIPHGRENYRRLFVRG